MLRLTGLLGSCLLLLSCVNEVREDSIAALSSQPRKRSVPVVVAKDVTQQTRNESLHYGQFVRLLETISNETMRWQGMQRLNQLMKSSAKNSDKNTALPAAQVILLFENLINDFPNEKHDRLLYQLAREYDEQGQQPAALHTLDRLVTRYPNSKYFEEAQFRRGEILFNKRRYVDAEAAYHAVLERTRNAVFFEQALFKQGWAQFKQTHYDASVNSFLQLVDRYVDKNTRQLKSVKASQQAFLDDAFRGVILSFSYQAGPVTVQEFFTRYPHRGYEDQIYDRLAKFYLEKKRYADAVKTYRTYVQVYPWHVSSPFYLREVIKVYEEGGFGQLALDARKDFVQRYGVKSDYWKHQAGKRSAEVIDSVKQNLKLLAQYYHSQAQKTGSGLDVREAQRWYRVWLASFPEAEETPQMNFYYAELLYENKKYEDAIREYETTAYDYPGYKQSGKAGYTALLAYEKLIPTQPQDQQLLSQQRSIDSAIKFAETFPQHPQAGRVVTRAALSLYDSGNYRRAYGVTTTAKKLASQKADKKSAWLIAGQIEFEWQEFDSAEKSFQHALQFMDKTDPEYKKVTEKEALAVYRQGELSRARGDLKSAVQHFNRVKVVMPGTGILPNAEFDAAAALIALRDWDKAAVTLETFRKEHPNHKFKDKVTRKLAVVYMEKGEDKKAAREFIAVSRMPAKKDAQLEALWQAAELYEQASDLPAARKTYEAFVERFPKFVERQVEAQQRLVEINGRENRNKSVKTWRQRIVATVRKTGGKASERMRYLAAQSSFALAEPVYDAYRKVQLKVPLKKSLANKKKRMTRALKAYSGTAEFKVAEYITAATFRIAEIYRDMSLAIYNSERPPKLKGEELEQYDVLLEEKAYPFEEKAISFHEVNVKRISTGVTGIWVQKSLEQLKELFPVRYAKQEKVNPFVESIE